MSKQNSHEVTSKKQTNKPLFTPGLTRFCIVMVIIIIAAIVIPNSITQIHEKLFPEAAITEIVKQKLENMGLLVTQASYSEGIIFSENDRKVGNITVPLTKSKAIYSYRATITAGYNFADITLQEDGNKINVTLPDVQTISKSIDHDSFRMYLDEQSIFAPISPDIINEDVNDLLNSAEKTAIANGLYDNAYTNAKTILTGFLSSILSDYEINVT